MRDKLNTLPVVELRKLAKAAGLSGISTMKKAQLIEALITAQEKQNSVPAAPTENPEKEKSPEKKPAKQTAENVAEENEAEKKGRVKKTPVSRQPSRKLSVRRQPRRKETRPGQTESSQMKPAVKEPVKEEAVDEKETLRAEAPAIKEPETAETLPAAVPGETDAAAESGIAPAASPSRPASPYNSGEIVSGILEVMSEGYGFLRSENYMSGDNDIYIGPPLIRRFNLKTGDCVTGMKRIKSPSEKFAALLYITNVNGLHPSEVARRKPFETMTPIFPDERIHLEIPEGPMSMRIVDLISPIGKGQRGMIVSPPKAGKTTLLKQTAKSIITNHPDMHLIVLLIDERPEEVTDIKESLSGDNVEVIYSTFDELPDHHKRVSEMVLNRAKRLVECHQDVTILLDSITRLARAYNLLVAPSGRTLSGGLDPTALYMPKQFFGAARNMREKGSLTILATALVDTGSRMDDVVFEEFKGTGNMELVLDRSLSEKRIFPAIDLLKSGTRRDDLLLSREEQEVMYLIRRYTGGAKPEDAIERILEMFHHTKNNREFLVMIRKTLASNKYNR